MASDYLLFIDGIKGESQDSKHKDQIDILSFSWGVSQAGSQSFGGGGGAGKAIFQDIHFTSKASVAGPNLMLACATGKHIKKAVLSVRKAGGKQEEYYIITMTDCLISSFQSGGSEGGDSVPMEQYSVNYAKVEFEYKTQKPDGTMVVGAKAGYDIKRNKEST